MGSSATTVRSRTYDANNVAPVAQTTTSTVEYRPPVPPAANNPRGRAFAELIRDARQRKGWTQDVLVEKSGVSRSTILRWEAGDASRPDPDQVRAVCQALSIKMGQAAVALGYADPPDITATTGGRQVSPELEAVSQFLENPRVPPAAKRAIMAVLNELQTQADDRPNGRQAG